MPRIAVPLAGSMTSVFQSAGGAVVLHTRTDGRVIGGPGADTPSEEILGTRQFEGVRALGRKTTSVIPTGQIGNDRPIEITDERWESPELRMLLYSRNSDPRTGVVEYRLTNINRSEPPADLFMIPNDYTLIQPPLPPPAPAPPAFAPPVPPAPPGPGARGRSRRDPATGR